MAVDCNLPHRFAKQNARKRLIDEGLISRYNEILDYPKLIKRINEFNDYAKKNYGVDAKLVHIDDVNQSNKVIFNSAAFNAIDIVKGKVPDGLHDTDTLRYLNQVRNSPDYSPEFNPNTLFGDTSESEDSIPRTGLTRIVSLKQMLLDRAKNEYAELGNKIESSKGDASEFNRLSSIRADLKDYIFGNDSKGVKGLQNELSDLSKIDSRAPEIIAPFIEKELQRLDTLVKSTDSSHLKEAKEIIKFIKSMANFDPIVSNSSLGHPLYNHEELYDKDNNFLLTPTMVKPFKDWAITADEYDDKLKGQEINYIENWFNTNPKIQALYNNKKFSYKEITSTEGGLKDASWLDSMLMDMSAGIMSHNGLMPQVLKNTVDDSLERHFSWSKEANEEMEGIAPKLKEELIKQGYTLDRLGFAGVKGVSYDIFRQKLPDEIQSNNNFAQKYSYNYQDKLEDMQNKYEQGIRSAYNFDGDQTGRNLKFSQAYNARNRWLKENTKVVNPALLSEITDNPEFNGLRSNFRYTKEQQEVHQNELKSIVGEDHYKKIIESQEKKVRDYLVQVKNYENQLMQEEGVSSVNDLSERAANQFQIWRAQNSLFKAIDYLRDNLPQRIGTNDYHSNFDYNEFVPLKTDVNGKDLNHYDKNYEVIEKNPVFREFHDILTKNLSEMYSRFDYDEQENLPMNSIPLLERKRTEIFLDKNMDFWQAISAVSRDWWDHFKGGFGIRTQNSFNFAKTNPNTGLPDYKVNDVFIKQNLRGIQDIFKIKSTKFLNEYNKIATKTDEIESMGKFTSIPSQRLRPGIIDVINKFTGRQYSIQELRDQYGDNIPIGKIIYQNAQHEIAQNKSFDLPKIMMYFTHLTAEYSARKEMLPTVELVKNHYQGILKPVVQNTGSPITNAQTGNTQLNGLRTNAIKQWDSWFDDVILGHKGLKEQFGVIKNISKAGDDLTPEEKANYLKQFFHSVANNTSFDGKIYNIQEKKTITEINEALKGLGDSNEDKKTRAELEGIRDNLGKDASLSATLSSLMTFTRFKMLGFNLSSSLTNFIDGQVANTLSAASGNYFPHEYLDTITPTDMIRADIAGQINPGLMSDKMAKAYYLAKKMDVFQDATNELQKASSQSAMNNLNIFAPLGIFAKSEQYNQLPVIVATLRDHEITGLNNEKSNIWDQLQGEYNSDKKQWKFTLKPEFATDENKKSWEEFNGQNYFNYKTRVRQVIRDTHSHGLDPTAGMMAKKTLIGQAMTMFKTFLPREFYKRFAVEQDNVHLGIEGFKGRYHSHTGVTGAIQGGITGAFFLGPAGAIFGSGLGAILGSKYGASPQIDTMNQLLDVNKFLFRKLMGMPVNAVSRLISGKDLINSHISDATNNKFNFSQQDFRNFKVNMQSMAVQLSYMALLFMTKALFWDDKDKSNSARRETHNLLANRLMQLSGQTNMYLNPVEVGSTVLAIPMLQLFTNVGTTIAAVDKFMKGEDTITSGVNAGHSRLGGDLRKSFAPGITSSSYLGFGNQMKHQFTPSPIDDYFKSEESKTKEQVKAQRASRRLELENEFQDIEDEDQRHTAITKELNKEFPRAKSTHHKTGLYN